MNAVKFVRAAESVRRYAMVPGYERSEEAAKLAHAAAHGDNTALGSLADKLEELGSPAASVVREAWNGAVGNPSSAIEGDYFPQSRLDYHARRVRNNANATPSYYPVLAAEHNDEVPGYGAVEVAYYELPDGRHFWRLGLHSSDHNTVRRSWLIPTTPEEVRGHVSQLRDFQLKNMQPGKFPHDHNPDWFANALEAAGIPPLADTTVHIPAHGHMPDVADHPEPEVPGGEHPVTFARAAAAHYSAWRAPAGGIVSRGVYYVGGKMIPDMTGPFMNPPKQPAKSKFDPAKLERARSRMKSRKPKSKHIVVQPGTEGNGGGDSVSRCARAAQVVRMASHPPDEAYLAFVCKALA